jgi:hypothetical protein
MNEAEKINEISNWVEAFEAAEASCRSEDQNLENAVACFYFKDGSAICFSESEKWVIEEINYQT